MKSNKVHIRDTEREVLNYNTALQRLYADVRAKTFDLSIHALETIQKQVVDGLMDNPAECGHLRQAPVVIRNPRRLDEIVFMPPDVKDVKPLLTDLIRFINQHTGKIVSHYFGGAVSSSMRDYPPLYGR